MNDFETWVPSVDGFGLDSEMALRRNGPVVRTDYLSTQDVAWSREAQPDPSVGSYLTVSDAHRYRPGETEHQLWWGPLVTPGVPLLTGAEQAGSPASRFRDGIRIIMPQYYYGGTRFGFIDEDRGDTSELQLRRNGAVVGTSSSPLVQFTVPDERAQYELSMSVHNGIANFADTSVATQSTWRFESARVSDSGVALPLVRLDYELPANGFNEVPAGAPYPLTITPGYQPGASGPGHFAVSAQVSYDDGTTWADAPVHAAHGRFQATMPTAPAGASFASVKVVTTDTAGNQLSQQIDRAWRIAS